MFTRFIIISLLLLALSGCAQPPAAPPPTAPPTSAAQAAVAATLAPAATPTAAPALTPTAPSTATPPPTNPASVQESRWLMSSVWGSSGSDVFVVTFPGPILHYDGRAWSAMDNSTRHWLTTVRGSSGSDVFAVGDTGTILHYDGSTWSSMESGTGLTLIGLWGSSASDVFAVGNTGTILHYDGSEWSPMNRETSYSLLAVWGSSASDVFTVGNSGTILHYDGNAWSPMSSGATKNLWGVWGSSGSDVFAIGESGTILHYDGTAWSPMNSGTTTDLWAGIWGSSGHDVFALGDKGTILHYDGTAWSPMDSGTTYSLESVWGSSGSDVFAVGHNSTILHYDGSAWSDMSIGALAATPVAEAPAAPTPTAPPPLSPTPPPTPTSQPTEPAPLTRYNLNSVWGSSGSDVFAVGELGTIVHYDGSTWSPMNSGKVKNFTSVWGNSSSDVFATGTSGAMLHYDGSAWSPMDSKWPLWVIGAWGSSDRDVFAVGEGGIILHYDGSAWSPMNSGVFETLTAGWGSSGRDIFVVGGDGRILHYDGAAWSTMPSGTLEQLWGVWGSSGSDVFAVGYSGTILHYDGRAWSPMDSGTTQELYGVWGSSGSDVFVSGEASTVLHYDGNGWSAMNSGPDVEKLTAVWGSSGRDVFAVGYSGTILHYDGRAWSLLSSAPAATPMPEALTTAATPQAKVELIEEKITSQALAGNLLGDRTERTVNVLLPPGYATSDQRYPVVYVMPWGDGEPRENTWGFKRAMELLLRKGESEEMIIVVPDGTNKLGASQFRSSPTIGDYETYVTQEVVDYVDTHYRTLPARDSRGLAGCSNGGGAAMRLGLKYPNVFSVVAPTGGDYDDSPEVWQPEVEAVQRLTELPQDISDLGLNETVGWWVQAAAGTAPDPDNPPFYCEMPFRIVNGRGEFVPEVIAKIVEHDAAHEAQRYVQQPVRLRGILIQHGLYDGADVTNSVHSFEKVLTDLGIEHEYREEKTGHCGSGWEAASLKYMSDKLAFTAASSSPPLAPTASLDSALVSKIETFIEKTMDTQLPGLAISIIKDGQVVYSKGFGLAELGTDRAVTPETVFQLASESKMMVGIALMQLKEEGKIDLDAPVTDYLPYFQLADERYQEITIRQLLSHRSGLDYSTGYGFYSYSSDYRSPEYDEEALERHVRNLTQVELRSAPGKQMQYSDLGFEILGDVIAKVSGQSFEDYTQEHIFTPLGMQHTSFMVRDIPPELLAAPHSSKTAVNSFFPYSRQHAPSSHLFSNVEDMSRYALAHLNQGQLGEMRILPAAVYDEMWAPQGDTNLWSPWEREVGLGWFLGGEEGHHLVGHGGMDIGFGCGFIMAPDDGLAVVVMVNREYAAENFSCKVMEWLLEAEAKL